MVRELEELGVKIVPETRVERILADECVRGVKLEDGREVEADYVIAAPGRVGANWMMREAKRLGLRLRYNPIDVGVRVEIPRIIYGTCRESIARSEVPHPDPNVR
nr:FAD-dependent oxidoreductase [Methanopyrus sp. SNP6]